MRKTDRRLAKLLGNTPKGPSLSFQEGQFVLYDCPAKTAGDRMLARGRTLKKLVGNARKKKTP